MERQQVTLASLFDGIGGAPLCAEMCGAVPVWASEIEKFLIKVTEHHFPSMKHYGDITRINGREVEPVDIIVGGSPCQDLSIAGKRAGLEGGRSGLFMEQIRIVKEMRSHGTNKPRYMVWENVPGAFSSGKPAGEDFRIVLEETARIAGPAISIPRSPNGWANSGSILGDGFSISWRVLDSKHFGVPQRRRRVYIVADFGGQSAPEILFVRQGVPWNPAPRREQGEETSHTATHSVGIQKGTNTIYDITHGSCAQESIGVSPTLTSRMGTGGNQVPIMAFEPCETICKTLTCDTRMDGETETFVSSGSIVRRITPLECERLQGYPDDYTNIPGASDSARYKALGNSFSIPCALFVIQGCIEKLEDT